MYIGPWQELKLARLLQHHQRLVAGGAQQVAPSPIERQRTPTTTAGSVASGSQFFGSSVRSYEDRPMPSSVASTPSRRPNAARDAAAALLLTPPPKLDGLVRVPRDRFANPERAAPPRPQRALDAAFFQASHGRPPRPSSLPKKAPRSAGSARRQHLERMRQMYASKEDPPAPSHPSLRDALSPQRAPPRRPPEPPGMTAPHASRRADAPVKVTDPGLIARLPYNERGDRQHGGDVTPRTNAPVLSRLDASPGGQGASQSGRGGVHASPVQRTPVKGRLDAHFAAPLAPHANEPIARNVENPPPSPMPGDDKLLEWSENLNLDELMRDSAW